MRFPQLSREAKIFLLVAVVAVLVRILFLIWARGTMVDDAYISLQHARNLIEGKGLVYNEGERVLAVSGPLYTIWTAALLLISKGIDPGYLIGLANIAFFGLAAWAIWSLRREMGTTCSIFAFIVFSTFLRFIDNSLVGMETPLFLLAILGSLICLKRGWLGWLSLVLGASVLIRPEGVLWVASVLLVLAVKRARPQPRHLLPGAILLLAWIAFCTYYYGSPVPQSLKAKSGWVLLGPHQSPFLTFTETFKTLSLLELPARVISSSAPYLRAILLLAALASVFFFACGTVAFFRRRSLFMSFPVLFALYLAFYLAGRGRVDFSWYGIPSGFAYMVTVVCGLGSVAKRLPPKPWTGRMLAAAGTLLAVALLCSSIFVWRATRARYYGLMRSSYQKAGEFVDQVASPTDRLLTGEVGMIGYRARRFVYGLGGIVSPEIMDLYREHSINMPISEILKRFKPEFVVLDGHQLARLRTQGDTTWVEANYEVVAQFPAHQVLRKTR